MIDFEEELTLETHELPWLIWIQVLVLLLLMILIYCSNLFPLDLSSENDIGNNDLASSSSAAPPFIISQAKTHMHKPALKQNTAFRNRLQPSQERFSNALKGHIYFQMGEAPSIRGERATNNTNRRRVEREEEITERESTSSEEANINDLHHPCHYFRLASLAFLKCFGLDPTSENSSSSSPE